MRESIDGLIRSVGHQVKLFASAEEFLTSAPHRRTDCLISDVCLPGMSGIELHRHLLACRRAVPVIFITGHASDERAWLEAVSDCTVAYLIKPFAEDELLDAVAAALDWQPASSRSTAKPWSSL